VGDNDSQVWGTLTKFMLGLAVFAIVIFVIAGYMAEVNKQAAMKDNSATAEKAITERIAPVAQVKVAGDTVAAEPKQQSAKDLYASACFACHGTGAAGAPILGDKAALSARIGQGMDLVYKHAIEGLNGMPPKGGRADLSDDAIKSIVDYMIEGSK